jgi:hypothetical protein
MSIRQRCLRLGEPPVYHDGHHTGHSLELPAETFRRTRDGHVLLFVLNDRGQLRGYRVDRIAGIRPTIKPFRPRLRVEF